MRLTGPALAKRRGGRAVAAPLAEALLRREPTVQTGVRILAGSSGVNGIPQRMMKMSTAPKPPAVRTTKRIDGHCAAFANRSETPRMTYLSIAAGRITA